MLIPVFFFRKPMKFHIVLLKRKVCKAVKFSNQRSSKRKSELPAKEKGTALINTFTAFNNLTSLSQLIFHLIAVFLTFSFSNMFSHLLLLNQENVHSIVILEKALRIIL